jgi:hypothetical protein
LAQILILDSLVDARKDSRLHQVGNNLEGFLLKLLSQVANHDRRLDGNHLCIGGEHHFRRGALNLGGLGSAGTLLLAG